MDIANAQPKAPKQHKYARKEMGPNGWVYYDAQGNIISGYLGNGRKKKADEVKSPKGKKVEGPKAPKVKAQPVDATPVHTPEETEALKYKTAEEYANIATDAIRNDPTVTLDAVDEAIDKAYDTWNKVNLSKEVVDAKVEEHKAAAKKVKAVKSAGNISSGAEKVIQGKIDQHEVEYLADVNNQKVEILRSEGRISDAKHREIIERITEKVNKVSNRLFNNVTERYAEFWEYAEENLLFYHGTNETFDKFKSQGGAGIYFTTNRKEAESFANEPKLNNEGKTPIVMKVALDIKNPAPQDKVKLAYDKATGGNPVKMAIDDLRTQGYDGIIRSNEVVVFDPGQVYTEKQLKEVWDASFEELQEKKRTTEAGLRPGQPKLGFNMSDTVARERFDFSKLEKLSFGGSDRDVYLLPNGNVLKVAKSPRGLDQNDASSDYNAEDSQMIPETIEVGKNYIVKERVEKPDASTRAMVRELSNLSFWGNGKYEAMDQARRIINHYSTGDEENGLGDDFSNYDLLWGDMTAIRNWGTKNGHPILLDEGTLNGQLIDNAHKGPPLTDPTFREIYYQSRAAKKQYRDSDNKSKY